jgi:hypothetical protein
MNSIAKLKRIGVILIVVGAFIPSVLYPFTSLTRTATILQVAFSIKGAVYSPRLNDLEIVLKKGYWNQGEYQGYFEGRLAIPYSYTLAIGITMVFLGIGLMTLTTKKN